MHWENQFVHQVIWENIGSLLLEYVLKCPWLLKDEQLLTEINEFEQKLSVLFFVTVFGAGEDRIAESVAFQLRQRDQNQQQGKLGLVELKTPLWILPDNSWKSCPILVNLSFSEDCSTAVCVGEIHCYHWWETPDSTNYLSSSESHFWSIGYRKIEGSSVLDIQSITK